MKVEALGAVDVMFFSNAVSVLDALVNTAYVELIDAKKYLGGRVVTIVVGGTVSNVTMALEKIRNLYPGEDILKNTVIITNPHKELLKFL